VLCILASLRLLDLQSRIETSYRYWPVFGDFLKSLGQDMRSKEIGEVNEQFQNISCFSGFYLLSFIYHMASPHSTIFLSYSHIVSDEVSVVHSSAALDVCSRRIVFSIIFSV
jgi:hypothetical protein